MSLFLLPSSPDNCVGVTARLLKLLKVKVFAETIEKRILEHPDHPSLLSISDALEKWDMNVLAATVTYDQLAEAKTACIAQIKRAKEDFFITIKNCSPTEIQYYNEKSEFVKQSKTNFLKIWTGVTLFAEKTENSGERGYKQKSRVKLSNQGLAVISGVALVVWAVTSWMHIESVQQSLLFLSFLMTSILGVLVSVFLLWYEVDAYNPIVQKICSTGKKVNCEAVLSSKESKVGFGIFNWSEIGFAYFTACFFVILTMGKNMSSLILLGNLSLLSVPVIIVSIYYQAVRIKQFCMMCLLIQTFLTLNVVATILTGSFDLSVELQTFFVFLSFLGMTLWLWRKAKPILLNAKQKINTLRSFNKLKNNPNVFLGLLQGSKKMTNAPGSIGIIIGKNDAPYKVTKVCNPYCPPCAAAHPVLERLVHKGLVQMQVIFTSSPDNDNLRALPARHLMALAAKNDEHLMHKALDDWYLPKEKNYELYAQKYPLNGEIPEQTDKIKAMRDWCDLEDITHTPTIYINEYRLPDQYRVADLIDVVV